MTSTSERDGSASRPRLRPNTIGRRAFGISLAFSIACLAASAAAMYLLELRLQAARISAEVAAIGRTQAASVVEALWDYDDELLAAMAGGLLLHPYINYVEISSPDGAAAASGKSKPGSARRVFPLVRAMPRGGTETIGELAIEVDEARIRAEVSRLVLVPVSVQAVFLAVQALVVLLLFSRLVTRHLARIADRLRGFEPRPEAPPLSLDKPYAGDELDLLVAAFNSMRRNLAAAREAELRAMEDLRLSEERNRILVEEAPDAILMYDCATGRFVSCNRRAEELLGRGREDLVGARPEALYAPEQPDGRSAERNIDEAVARARAGEVVRARRRLVGPAGAPIECDMHLSRIPPPERGILRVSYLDITDRVRAEEAVARSLREKELLLAEIYHRTNNNMQVIASFLSMEAEACEDERFRSILRSMTGRIASISLVHRQLYETQDLSRIDLGAYLGELAAAIGSGIQKDRPEIGVSVRAEPGLVTPIDTAIACGLVINELVANAARHAFPTGRPGAISVELSRSGPGLLAASVADDGAGLPAAFEFRRDGGIGLQTVIAVVESQLRGRVEIESSAGAGTRCRVTFRDDLYEVRI